jgi:hypothetical protein
LIRASLLVAALSGAVAAGAAAQADTTARDTTARRDSTPAPPDTVPALLPAFPLAIAPGPLPAGARYTFTADSLLFTNSRTLSDLLAHVPGVYVARGGWYGQAEPVLFGGRGAGSAALEVYWDGAPYLSIGRDSLALDPARIPLAPLERIDVIVLPAMLRVYLVTARPRSSVPATQIGIATGDLGIAEYRAGYSTRTRSGLGFSFLADWNALDGNATASTTRFNSTDLLLKAEYVPPGGRLGASFQLVSSSWHRRGEAGRIDEWRQERRDQLFRFFAAERGDGLGFRLTGTLSGSTVDKDTVVAKRALYQASLELSRAWPRASVAVMGRWGLVGSPTQLEVTGGWMPVRRVTLAGSARHSTYSGDRSGDRMQITGGVALPMGFGVRGELAWSRDVRAPLDRTDTLRQEATDLAGWLRWDHPRIMIEVGRGHRDAFTPLGFEAGIKPVDHLSRTPATAFIAAHASIRPLPGLELAGWYFDPVVGGGDFEPPHHARLSATFYSKFWRVYRSGIFALRAEVALESWSRWGLGGQDATGAQLRLGGASFVETNLEMQLAGVTLFWIIRNINGMRANYVQGLSHPKSVQVYGARWFFTN